MKDLEDFGRSNFEYRCRGPFRELLDLTKMHGSVAYANIWSLLGRQINDEKLRLILS